MVPDIERKRTSRTMHIKATHQPVFLANGEVRAIGDTNYRPYVLQPRPEQRRQRCSVQWIRDERVSDK